MIKKPKLKNHKLKRKILKSNDIIFFEPMSDSLGHAEFEICPVFKRGKMTEIFIYPRQQPNVKYYYYYKVDYKPVDFSINSWTHKGIDMPEVWLNYWCKEHKCVTFVVYVPIKSNCFMLKTLSNLSITFDYKQLPNDNIVHRLHKNHCCKIHGCKYGESDCPVAASSIEQIVPCEFCAHVGG